MNYKDLQSFSADLFSEFCEVLFWDVAEIDGFKIESGEWSEKLFFGDHVWWVLVVSVERIISRFAGILVEDVEAEEETGPRSVRWHAG